MIRKYPIVPGTIHHIYSRGVAKNPICNDEADRWRFLQGLALFNDTQTTSSILWRLERRKKRLTMNTLKEYMDRETRSPLVQILAYCLMGNHYHFIVQEIQQGGTTTFMRKLGTGYVRYFNNKHNRVGPLFQSRFKNILIENDQYLQYLLVYINVLNPAEFVSPHWKEQGIQHMEKVLKFAEEYPWSSHQDYLGKRGSLILDKDILSKILPTPKHYTDLVYMVLRDKKHEHITDLMLE